MFQKFHRDLTSETSVVKVFEPFNRVVLHHIKLHDFPYPPPQPQHPPSPPHKVQLKFLPPPLNLLSLNPLPLNHHAFYNSIFAEIETLQA